MAVTMDLKRLGKNLGGYLGEVIDIHAVLREIEIAAQKNNWASETFFEIGGFKLLALHRLSKIENAKRIYISAGIHGDEPAGPLAALKLLQENNWPENTEIFLLPCLNPIGFTLNQRENADGIDLNRDYRQPKSTEVRAHIAWLKRQPKFDLYLCLHEDWESHGFYLYDPNPDDKFPLTKKIIEAVKQICPIDFSEIIENRPAQNGIIRPKISLEEWPVWPEAFYLITQETRQGYTLEAPSDFPLQIRVNALVTGVNAGVKTAMEKLG
jgi:hypothetical protein